MDKYSKKWKPVFNKFELDLPYIAEHVDDWYPSDDSEITVVLENGSQYKYDFFSGRIMHIHPDMNNDKDYMDEKVWRIDFSSNLQHLMRKRGYVAETLAEATDISLSGIRKYMNGRATPSGHNIYKIAKVLKCSVSKLTEPR